MEKTKYQYFFDYIVEQKYPEHFESLSAECSRKAKEYFRKSAQPYLVVQRNGKDVLGYQQSNGSAVRIVLLEGEEGEAIEKVHQDLGHPGINATYNALRRTFYWKTISKDVKEYIRTCENCQKSAQFKLRPSALRPVPPPKLPFQIWGIDLTMLPESADGYRYLVVAVDHLTKFVEVKPLKGKEASGICLFLDELCARYGYPKAIITDQGREFCNSLIDGFCNDHEIHHRRTSAYHPQSNGLTEKMNGTLKTALRKLRGNKTWPQNLPTVLRGVRSRVTRSTGYSPYELVYSFMPRVVSHGGVDSYVNEELLDAIERGEDEEEFGADAEDTLILNANNHSQRLVKARDRIIVEKESQKRAHDAKHEVGTFKKGDIVKLQDTRRNTRKGENLAELFSGPYVISSVTKRNTAALVNQRTGERVKKLVSFARLAIYQTKSSDEISAMNPDSWTTRSYGSDGDEISDADDFTHLDVHSVRAERNAQRDRFLQESIQTPESESDLLGRRQIKPQSEVVGKRSKRKKVGQLGSSKGPKRITVASGEPSLIE